MSVCVKCVSVCVGVLNESFHDHAHSLTLALTHTHTLTHSLALTHSRTHTLSHRAWPSRSAFSQPTHSRAPPSRASTCSCTKPVSMCSVFGFGFGVSFGV